MQKFKFDNSKADRIFNIKTNEIIDSQKEELTSLRVKHDENNITGKPAAIIQMAELYAAHIKKLSKIKAEAIIQSLFEGKQPLSEIRSLVMDQMDNFIKSRYQTKKRDIQSQLSMLPLGPMALASVINKFQKHMETTQKICNDII